MRLDDAIEAAAIAEHPDYPVHDLDDMKIQNHRENMRKAFRAGAAFLRSPEGLRLLCEAEIERLEREMAETMIRTGLLDANTPAARFYGAYCLLRDAIKESKE
jgi:hypothetical protein